MHELPWDIAGTTGESALRVGQIQPLTQRDILHRAARAGERFLRILACTRTSESFCLEDKRVIRPTAAWMTRDHTLRLCSGLGPLRARFGRASRGFEFARALGVLLGTPHGVVVRTTAQHCQQTQRTRRHKSPPRSPHRAPLPLPTASLRSNSSR